MSEPVNMIVETVIYTDHPNYREPRNTHELIEAMAKWCPASEFRWKIGSSKWAKETVPFDYAAAIEEAYRQLPWWKRVLYAIRDGVR